MTEDIHSHERKIWLNYCESNYYGTCGSVLVSSLQLSLAIWSFKSVTGVNAAVVLFVKEKDGATRV